MKLDIAFDLDCCLIDFDGGLESVYNEHGYKMLTNDSYKIVSKPEMSKSKRNKLFKQTYKEHWRTPPVKGAVKLLETLHAKSQQPILIVTSRPTWPAHYTHELVKTQLCHVPYILCFADKEFGKSAYLDGIKYFVEDRKSTIMELTARGKIVFKPRHSWNIDLMDDGKVFEIKNVGDLIKYTDKFIKE